MNLSKIINPRITLLTILILFLALAGCSRNGSVKPILILTVKNGFGNYTGEILKAEGFNEFMIDSLANHKVTTSFLSQFDIIILPEQKIDASSKKMISEYVKEGGNLIAFRPDQSLAELFGITSAEGHVSEGYIVFNTAGDIGAGMTRNLIQFHGTADIYAPNGGKSLAALVIGRKYTEKFPAIVRNDYGKGNTVAFSYNLPKSIVLTRQGNPLFAGIEKDGIPGLRGMDLFTDGWLDYSNSTINQADEHMVFLSHCIESMNANSKPLPRLWYFPDTLKCLVTLTNDGEYKAENDFEPQFRDIDSMGAKMSLYVIGVEKVSTAWVDKWTARGFEIAGHPDDTKEAENPDWNNMDSVINAKKSEIASRYGLPVRTNVNHWFVWCGRDAEGRQDFGAQARLEEKNGIELDINYANYDMNSNQGDYFLGPLGTNQGNFTGSGLIMKFADANGGIINVYQHLNSVYDQQYNESNDPDGFYNCFKGLIDRSINNEVYSFISVKSHNDEYYFSRAPLLKMLSYANCNNIPVWTAARLLDFIKMRDEAEFSVIDFNSDRLSFRLGSSLIHDGGLTIMVPFTYRNKKIARITCDEKEAPFIIRSVKGHNYAMVTVRPGYDYSFKVNYIK